MKDCDIVIKTSYCDVIVSQQCKYYSYVDSIKVVTITKVLNAQIERNRSCTVGWIQFKHLKGEENEE